MITLFWLVAAYVTGYLLTKAIIEKANLEVDKTELPFMWPALLYSFVMGLIVGLFGKEK